MEDIENMIDPESMEKLRGEFLFYLQKKDWSP